MELSTQFLALVPIILALVQMAKVTGLNGRYSPFLAIILGIGGAFLFGDFERATVAQGLIAGLTASGLFSGYKASKE